MKFNQGYTRIFNILLTIVAYGYLFYKLWIYNDYPVMWAHFSSIGWATWITLLLVISLMPLNIFFEGGKWRELLRNIEPMTFAQAQKQVYYGYIGSFITPYRAGEYPTRVLMIKDSSKWSSAIGLGIVGSLILLLIEILFGLPNAVLFIYQGGELPLNRVIITLTFCLVAIAIAPWCMKQLAKRKWQYQATQKFFHSLSTLQLGQIFRVVLWSIARYVIWGIQLSLMLHFCGIQLTLTDCLMSIPIYYLAIALFPSLPVADIGIRSGWAIWIFGAYSPNHAGIALCVTLIWLINTILPMTIGSIIANNKKAIRNTNYK